MAVSILTGQVTSETRLEDVERRLASWKTTRYLRTPRKRQNRPACSDSRGTISLSVMWLPRALSEKNPELERDPMFSVRRGMSSTMCVSESKVYFAANAESFERCIKRREACCSVILAHLGGQLMIILGFVWQ